MTKQNNPFIEIPSYLRTGLLAYCIVYVLGLPLLNMFLAVDFSSYLLINELMKFFFGFLIYAPLIFKVRNIGILHPLILPIFISLARKMIVTKGMFLITPFLATPHFWQTTNAFNIPQIAMMEANITMNIYKILFLLMFYMGYFFLVGKDRSILIRSGRWMNAPVKVVTPILGIVMVIGLVYFLQSQGGITSYFSSWGKSRDQATEGLGYILGIIRIMYIFPLIWYAVSGNKVFKNPIFLILLVVSISAGFVTTGARSRIVSSAIPFIILYMFRNRTVPLLSFLVLGVTFFVIFGTLGKVRSSVYDGEVNWEILTETSFDEAIANSDEEVEAWSDLGADIAIFHLVPDRRDYLYGKSYLAAVFFWIPRAIWSDKPHATGYYVGREIFKRAEAGIPPSVVGDVFYNFGILGIIFFGFLKGALLRWISMLVYRSPQNNVQINYILYIILFDLSITPLGIVGKLQEVLLFIVVIQFLKFSRERYLQKKSSIKFEHQLEHN